MTLLVALSVLWLVLSPDGYSAQIVAWFSLTDILDALDSFQEIKNAASTPFYVTLMAFIVVGVLVRRRDGLWPAGRFAVLLGAGTWVIGIAAGALIQSADPGTQRLGVLLCWVAGTGMVLLVVVYVTGILALACPGASEEF